MDHIKNTSSWLNESKVGMTTRTNSNKIWNLKKKAWRGGQKRGTHNSFSYGEQGGEKMKRGATMAATL